MGKSEISRRALLGATASATAAAGVAATGGVGQRGRSAGQPPATGPPDQGEPAHPHRADPARDLRRPAAGLRPDRHLLGAERGWAQLCGGRRPEQRDAATSTQDCCSPTSKAIFITHQHADHIADYYNYFLLGGNVTNDSDDNLVGPVHVYGPGPAGGTAALRSGRPTDTVELQNPTPGISDLTARLTEGYAYSHNIFIRETAIRDVRTLIDVHDVMPPAAAGDERARATPRRRWRPSRCSRTTGCG